MAQLSLRIAAIALLAWLASASASRAQVWIYATGAGGNTIVPPSPPASAGIVPVVSTALESSHVMKAAGGTLYNGYVVVPSAAAGFFMIFDAASAPAPGAVSPRNCLPVAAGGYGGFNFSGVPESYATGIVFAFSTAADCLHFSPANAWFHGDFQ